MDPEIKQLQEEVKRLTELNKDTNRVVHGMRRSQRWHTLVTVAWWAIVLGITAASYWFALPYIQKAQDAYSGIQQSAQKAESWQQGVEDFFSKLFGTSTRQ